MYLNGAWSRAVGGDQVVVRMKEVKSFTALLGRVLPRQHALGERARSGSAGEPEIDAGTTPINHRVDSSHRADNRADSRSLRHRAYVPSATPISTTHFRSKLHRPASVSRASFLPDLKPANSWCCTFKNQLICVQDSPGFSRIAIGIS